MESVSDVLILNTKSVDLDQTVSDLGLVCLPIPLSEDTTNGLTRIFFAFVRISLSLSYTHTHTHTHNFNDWNTDGSLTVADSNSVLSPSEILPIAKKNPPNIWGYFKGAGLFVCCVYLLESRRLFWVHSTYHYFIEDGKDIPKLSPFASRPGPSCSKLTMSLVNDSLKFTSSDTQICWNFLLKKCE